MGEKAGWGLPLRNEDVEKDYGKSKLQEIEDRPC